ncbi:MAG: alpha/beta fold hydrolase [Gammaproteobacteria bacterium]
MNEPKLTPKKISVNGIDTVIRDSGGVAEAVVFVHGNPGSGADWSSVMSKVSQFSRTVAPDMPGFGQSQKPQGFDYTVDGYARHLDAVLGELSVDKAHLVLHDFGGPWGLAWAAMNPQRVASLSLVNIGVLQGYRWHYLAKLWRTPLIGEFAMATTTRVGFGLLLKHGNPRGLPKAYLDEMFNNFDSGTKRAVLKLYRATSGLGDVAKLFHNTLRPLDLETLVIWGKCDPYIPYRYAEMQKATFPRAEVHYLEDSGHWPFIDNPEGFESIIVPFLERVCSAVSSAT